MRRFTSILGQITVLLSRSVKARCLIKRYVVVCRHESTWVTMIIPRFPTTVSVQMMRKIPNRGTCSSGPLVTHIRMNSISNVRFCWPIQSSQLFWEETEGLLLVFVQCHLNKLYSQTEWKFFCIIRHRKLIPLSDLKLK